MPRELTLLDRFYRYKQFFVRAADERSDFINPLCMFLLSVMGIFFIYSAQCHSNGTQWEMQTLWLVTGMLLYWVISALNYKLFLQNAHLLYGVCLIMLVYLAIEAMGINLPIAVTRFGSTRWLDFGVISIQPSEFAKVGTLLMLCSLLARTRIGDLRDSFKTVSMVTILSGVPFFLIFLEPDLGSCLVFIPMVLALLYISNLSQRFFAATLGVCLLVALLLGWDIYRYAQFLEDHQLTAMQNQSQNAYGSGHSWLPLKDYQRNRILDFIAPDIADPQGIGTSWNRTQALIAVGSGGLWGKGWTEGTQAKLGYLPRSVASNDFIASNILEEVGFIGGASMLSLYAILMLNTLRIAHRARDRFGMLLAVGTSALLIVHLFINLGMNVGFMPITGVPLPFLSYGGSFMFVCWILQGFVQSVYRFRRDFS